MIQLKTKQKGNQTLVIHKLTGQEQLAYLEQSLIEQGEIPNLFPVEIQNKFTGISLQFTLENCILLRDYFQSGISVENFCWCLLEMIHIILDCESHGISISNLELRPAYIYYDTKKRKVQMLYWPVNSLKEYPNVKGTFTELAESYRYLETQRELFFQIISKLGKREKLDLREWQKQITACVEMTGIQRTHFRIFHANKQRWITLYRFPFSIGRQSGCDYAVNDPMVSRCHFTILQHNGRLYIRDDDSANGTRVDGRKLEAKKIHLLKNESVILAGGQKFQISEG